MLEQSPLRGFIPGSNSPAMERSLILSENRKKCKNSLLWGALNICFLSIILYDLSYTCPLYVSYVQYAEYALAVILFLNILFYVTRYLLISWNKECIAVTPIQKRLLGIKESDPDYNVISTPPSTPITTSMKSTPNASFSTTPMNTTALSWRSSISPNESMNYSMSSPSWSYQPGTPLKPQSPDFRGVNTPSPTFPVDGSTVEFITDEQSLSQYLKDFEAHEKSAAVGKPAEQSSSLLGSFWRHPAAKSPSDASPYFKKCQYQLATQTPKPHMIENLVKSPPSFLSCMVFPNYYYGNSPRAFTLYSATCGSPGGQVDDKGSPNLQRQGLEMWRRLNVDSATLTQWNANLRMWISQTILERLVEEISNVDELLHKNGLTDISVGTVGIDRLRKTAQSAPVNVYIPTLNTVIPFLDLSGNQEYLVNRIRELSKGGCMSKFKWNGGGHFNGKEWDDSLPSDSAIIMHLFTSYLDTQLIPLPSKPDAKSFTSNHFIKSTDKMPTLTPTTLILHEVSTKPPHYRVIIGEEIFEMVKGYNNLFHSTLLFLYHVNKKEHGMLGRVNLGRSGINMLWIIDS